MRPRERQAALERIGSLCEAAARNARARPALARAQADLARRISMRKRVRMPHAARSMRCRRCKSLSVPGSTARVRVGRSGIRAVRITCAACGTTRRVPLRARS